MGTPMDFAAGNPESKYCRHCVDDLDELKSYEEIFGDQIGFLMEREEGISREDAASRVKEQLSKTPTWHNHA